MSIDRRDLNHRYLMITIIDLLTNEEKKKVKYVTLKSNEILFHEGEEAKYLGVLISGALSIESNSLTG